MYTCKCIHLVRNVEATVYYTLLEIPECMVRIWLFPSFYLNYLASEPAEEIHWIVKYCNRLPH